MMIKNEAKIIRRCLDSTKGIIDFFSICDTGSTDDTLEIIKKFQEETKIKGSIYNHPWKNFQENRILSLNSVINTNKELGYRPEETYLLLMDADMILQNNNFDLNKLDKDSYYIEQRFPDNTCIWNLRLIKSSKNWTVEETTHEYYKCSESHTHEKLDTLYIIDMNDGGNKKEKYQRDISLLEASLKKDPFNRRTLTYLAQTYRDLGKYRQAIEYYQKAIKLSNGSLDEQTWHNKYMIGYCLQMMNAWPNALIQYLEAHEMRPQRVEPLYRISRYYRINKQYRTAFLFIVQGLNIPYPDDYICIERDAYDWGIKEELSIISYYLGYKELGLEMCQNIYMSKNILQPIKNRASKNLIYYLEKIEASYIKINYKVEDGWYPMNPSIINSGRGYIANLRLVNFYIDDKGKYVYKDKVKTKNILLYLDENFNITKSNELDHQVDYKEFPSKVEGLEDVRLIDEKNFIATVYNTEEHQKARICKGKIEANKLLVEEVMPSYQDNEKNWLPLMDNGKLKFIYDSNKFVDSEGKITKTKDSKLDLSSFRGSAGVIEYKNNYLYLIHEVTYDPQNNKKIYRHRFVIRNRSLSLDKISKPFYFREVGIEFCCGLARIPNGGVVVGLGVKDREAYWCIINDQTLENIFPK